MYLSNETIVLLILFKLDSQRFFRFFFLIFTLFKSVWNCFLIHTVYIPWEKNLKKPLSQFMKNLYPNPKFQTLHHKVNFLCLQTKSLRRLLPFLTALWKASANSMAPPLLNVTLNSASPCQPASGIGNWKEKYLL